MITINAMGDTCPIPVVKTRKAIASLKSGDVVETLVDNEIAVQNLTKMARQMGYKVASEKVTENEFKVRILVETGTDSGSMAESRPNAGSNDAEGRRHEADQTGQGDGISCIPDARRNKVVVISSDRMGEGNDELGRVLIKGFIYAISQQDQLPGTMLFYNGGAQLTCQGSASLEDLKALEAQGVEILTCGTCLNYYGLADQLAVGEVTNMYVIAEKMTEAGLLIKP